MKAIPNFAGQVKDLAATAISGMGSRGAKAASPSDVPVEK